MNFEHKADMLAWQWGAGSHDFEVMLSLEPKRWVLPLGIEGSRYGGDCNGYASTMRVFSLRLLCTAIHFSWDTTVETRGLPQRTT